MVLDHRSIPLSARTSAADLKFSDGPAAAHRSARDQRRVQLGTWSMVAAVALVAAGGFMLAGAALRAVRQTLSPDRPHMHLWAEADQVLAAGLPDAVLFAPWTRGMFVGGGRFRLDGTLVGKFAAAWGESAEENLPDVGELATRTRP
jgi:hypothetical protein